MYKATRLSSTCLFSLAAYALLAVSTSPASQAQTETVVYNFTDQSDGGQPVAGLIRDSAGYLYGTTYQGAGGYGTVFKTDVNGHLKTLHGFTNQVDGGGPQDGLIRDSAGNLYGTAAYGGTGTCSCGTLFKIDSSGKFTVLHTFTGGHDGAVPLTGLVQDAAGNLYGTTYQGGDFSYGTVFRVSPTGGFTVLHQFTNGPDGGGPSGDLIRDSAGSLFGTTRQGASGSCFYPGCGVVFKIDHLGVFTTLYAFTGGSDGGAPLAGLVRDSQGNLYGTTSNGGLGICFSGCGVVFMLDSSNTFSVLHSFGFNIDGGEPVAALVRDSAGNLYGTTVVGGTSGWGTAFKIDAAGNFTLLYTFTNGSDGGSPRGRLNIDRAGNLFGTTGTGGGSSYGTIFKISQR
jgi:uncharacterized repeat protein (TIGR03803 family)